MSALAENLLNEGEEGMALNPFPESDPPRMMLGMAAYELVPESLAKLACEGRPRKLKQKLLNMERENKNPSDDKDSEGLTPLHYAARYNRLICMQLLHELGNISVNAEDICRRTPLHYTARYRSQKKVGENGLNSPPPLPPPLPFSYNDMLPEEEEESSVQDVVEYLLSKKADIRKKDLFDCTALHYAAMRGSEIAATILINHCPDLIKELDNESQNPLHLACQYNHYWIVLQMLDKDPNLFAQDFAGNTPLSLACSGGYGHIVDCLLQKQVASNEWRMQELLCLGDVEKNTPLIKAATSGAVDVVQMLLKYGADVNEKNYFNETALHRAAYNGNCEMVEFLLDHVAEIDARDADFRTPLYEAAKNDQPEVIKLLIRRGAEMNTSDESGITPLIIAVENKSENAAKTLIELGSDIYHCDMQSRNVLLVAAKNNCVETVKKLLEDKENQIKLLMSTDRINNTALHEACYSGNVEVVKVLIQYDDLLTAMNEDEYTPLHFAAKHGRTQIVQLLCKDKSSNFLDVLDCSNETPLHMAANNGHTRIVEILLAAGAEIEPKNRDMWTPLDFAAEKGFTDVVKILLEEGASVDSSELNPHVSPLYLACKNGHPDVVKLLLEKGAVPSAPIHGSFGARLDITNALDAAIEHGHKLCVRAILNIRSWQDALRLCQYPLNEKGRIDTPMRKLIRKMPDMAHEVFDKCVEKSDYLPLSDESYEITLNYEFLDDAHTTWMTESRAKPRDVTNGDEHIGNSCDHELVEPTVQVKNGVKGWLKQKLHSESNDNVNIKKNHPLLELVKSERHELLRHPLVLCLLETKWKTFGRRLYYFNLFLYCIFLAALTLYIIHFPKNKTASCSFNSSYVPNPDLKLKNKVWIRSLQWSIVILAIIAIIKELMQLAVSKLHYFELENLVEWTIYVGSSLSVIDFNDCQRNTGLRFSWQHNLAAVAIFLAWLNLVLFIKKVPRFGIYVVMFTDILSTFIQFFCVFILFILAFAFGFYTILSNQTAFQSLPKALLKTSVMMTGEFDFEALFNEKSDEGESGGNIKFPVVTYILFVGFVILMSILLMNLLVGLAVDDTQAIMRKAELRRYAMQVELVLGIESLIPELSRRKHELTQTIYPNRSGNLCHVSVDDGRDALMEYLMNKSINGEVSEDAQEQTAMSVRKMKRDLNQIRNENRQLKKMMLAVIDKLDINYNDVDEEDFDG